MLGVSLGMVVTPHIFNPSVIVIGMGCGSRVDRREVVLTIGVSYCAKHHPKGLYDRRAGPRLKGAKSLVGRKKMKYALPVSHA